MGEKNERKSEGIKDERDGKSSEVKYDRTEKGPKRDLKSVPRAPFVGTGLAPAHRFLCLH